MGGKQVAFPAPLGLLAHALAGGPGTLLRFTLSPLLSGILVVKASSPKPALLSAGEKASGMAVAPHTIVTSVMTPLKAGKASPCVFVRKEPAAIEFSVLFQIRLHRVIKRNRRAYKKS